MSRYAQDLPVYINYPSRFPSSSTPTNTSRSKVEQQCAVNVLHRSLRNSIPMACRKVLAVALAVLAAVAALSTPSSAQSTSSCTTAIVGLAPCLNYMSGNATTPSSPCCSQLSSVVKSEPQCLCALLNGGASSFGVILNQTRALELPGACTVQTPPVSLCSAVSGAKSPSASPAAPATPATSTGGGSKAAQSSDAASHKWSSSMMLVIVFVAASTSFMKL